MKKNKEWMEGLRLKAVGRVLAQLTGGQRPDSSPSTVM